MGIDKFNHEGYSDPTTYEALTNIQREEKAADKKAAYLPLVYVCSPYAGDIENNVKNEKKYRRFVKEAADGDVSIAFVNVPGTKLTLELMQYHSPEGRKEPVFFAANDVSGARHVALKISKRGLTKPVLVVNIK